MFLLKFLTALPIDAFLGWLERRHAADLAAANSESQRAHEERVENIKSKRAALHDWATATQTGIGAKVFWTAWAMAAFPTSAWFGLIMIDTFVGWVDLGIPLPPKSIEPYVNAVWHSIFYTGGFVASVQVAAKTATRLRK